MKTIHLVVDFERIFIFSFGYPVSCCLSTIIYFCILRCINICYFQCSFGVLCYWVVVGDSAGNKEHGECGGVTQCMCPYGLPVTTVICQTEQCIQTFPKTVIPKHKSAIRKSQLHFHFWKRKGILCLNVQAGHTKGSPAHELWAIPHDTI